MSGHEARQPGRSGWHGEGVWPSRSPRGRGCNRPTLLRGLWLGQTSAGTPSLPARAQDRLADNGRPGSPRLPRGDPRGRHVQRSPNQDCSDSCRLWQATPTAVQRGCSCGGGGLPRKENLLRASEPTRPQWGRPVGRASPRSGGAGSVTVRWAKAATKEPGTVRGRAGERARGGGRGGEGSREPLRDGGGDGRRPATPGGGRREIRGRSGAATAASTAREPPHQGGTGGDAQTRRRRRRRATAAARRRRLVAAGGEVLGCRWMRPPQAAACGAGAGSCVIAATIDCRRVQLHRASMRGRSLVRCCTCERSSCVDAARFAGALLLELHGVAGGAVAAATSQFTLLLQHRASMRGRSLVRCCTCER